MLISALEVLNLTLSRTQDVYSDPGQSDQGCPGAGIFRLRSGSGSRDFKNFGSRKIALLPDNPESDTY